MKAAVSPSAATDSALAAATVANPSDDASSRIVADADPVPKSVTDPCAESVVNPRERKDAAAASGAPGARVVNGSGSRTRELPRLFAIVARTR